MFQQGQDLQPQAVPGVGRIQVGLICPPCLSLFPQICLDLVSGLFQQGTDQPAGYGQHAPQPGYGTAPADVEKYGFRLILHVMGDRDPAGTVLSVRAGPLRFPFQTCLLKTLITEDPAGFLNPQAMAGRVSCRVHISGPAGNLQAGAQVLRKSQVFSGTLPQPVMDMDGPEVKIQILPQGRQHQQQADGIRAAGYAGQDPAAPGRQHLQIGDPASDSFFEFIHHFSGARQLLSLTAKYLLLKRAARQLRHLCTGPTNSPPVQLSYTLARQPPVLFISLDIHDLPHTRYHVCSLETHCRTYSVLQHSRSCFHLS